MVALVTCLALFAACSGSAPVARATFEVAEVVPAGTGGAVSAPHIDPSQPDVLVTTITPFEIESASVEHVEHLDRQAIKFDLVRRDHEAFRAWSAAHIHRTIAVLIDHRVVSVVSIGTELPGSGMIDFSGKQPSREELERIAASLAPPK